MEIGKRFKVIISVWVFMSSFYICMPLLCAEAKTDVTAHIAPISNKPTDSDDSAKTDTDGESTGKSPKDKRAVGTGDDLIRVCVSIMSVALSMSFIIILFLRYRKIRE